MDAANFTLTFGGFVLLVGGLIWWLVQRQVAKNDEADARKEEADAKWKEGQEHRLQVIETELQDQRLQLERKISREELEKVYGAIERVSSKFDQGQTEMIRLLTALASSKTGGREQ